MNSLNDRILDTDMYNKPRLRFTIISLPITKNEYNKMLHFCGRNCVNNHLL